MNTADKAERTRKKARIAAIILLAIQISSIIVSSVIYWINVIPYLQTWEQSSIVYNIISTFQSILMPGLLLVCVLFFFGKKKGSVLMAIYFILKLAFIIYFNWYKIPALFQGFWPFFERDIQYVGEFILYILCIFSALNGFRRRWVLIAMVAFSAAATTCFLLISLIGTLSNEYSYYTYGALEYLLNYVEPFVMMILSLSPLLLYGLFSRNPSVVDVWTKIRLRFGTRSSKKELSLCEQDLAELRHRLEQGMITPEEFDERSAPVVGKINALNESIGEYERKVMKDQP